MASYNKPSTSKKSLGVIIVTTIFAIIGAVCIIIGYGSEFLTWLTTFGVVILVITFPILVFVIYHVISDKIKEM